VAELSPAAQAVMDAAYDSLDKRGYVSDQVAAALRAAASQMEFVQDHLKLLAIAAELEGGDEP